MKSKVDKGRLYIFLKVVLVSSFASLLFLASCKKDNPGPETKSLEQSVALSNDVEIKYSATLSNVDKAKLNVKKDGVLISTEEISDVTSSGPDYQKTYSYNTDPQITKGNYEFDLSSENSSDNLEKKTDITIPNYPSSVSYNSIDLNENSQISVTLNASDENPEDNPVSIVYIKLLDTKTQTILNGNNLNITALPNQTGYYQLEIELKSALGELEKKTLNGNIIEDTRMVINPFISPDLNGAEYNLLKTKAERDNFIQAKLNEDWVNTIPYSSINPVWVCGNYTLQLMTNSRDWGEKIKFTGWVFNNEYLYNGYKGNNLDSIYKNKGTLIDMGKLGLPINEVTLVDTSHTGSYFGHGMNWAATGDYLEKWEDLNFIEPQTDQINVQIGGVDIPENCDEVNIGYYYPTKDKIKGNYLKSVRLLEFRIENGTPILIWENKDPNLNIITQRGK